MTTPNDTQGAEHLLQAIDYAKRHGWPRESLEKIERIAESIERRAAQASGQAVQEGATRAARDVLRERQRQISVEGWTPEHDDEHDTNELAIAAACYLLHGLPLPLMANTVPRLWELIGWETSAFKPTDRRRMLVKACALALAEIERFDRRTTQEWKAGNTVTIRPTRMESFSAEAKAALSSPSAEQLVTYSCKLGLEGRAFDPPTTHRAYTYKHQPGNVEAYKLGSAAANARPGGDFIDFGLSLLRQLEERGFGVFELPASPAPAEQPVARLSKINDSAPREIGPADLDEESLRRFRNLPDGTMLYARAPAEQPTKPPVDYGLLLSIRDALRPSAGPEERNNVLRRVKAALASPSERPTDEQLGDVAYKGYDDYWTEDKPGIESEAWAASAKAVLKAFGSAEQPAQVGGIDVEAMLKACVPGGHSCDPQQVADAIRVYLNAWPSAPKD